MENETEQNLRSTKLKKRKYILCIVVILLFIISALSLSSLNQGQKPDPAIEKSILESLAKTLGKEPNDIVDEDFTKIESIYISQSTIVESHDPSILLVITKDITDFKLLEIFTNLKDLRINYTEFPKNKIPNHMKFLIKIGIIDPEDRFFLDLKSLGKLLNLQYLNLSYTPVKNIKPLSNLINLEYLNLNGTHVSDLEPLKNINNLKRLNIYGCENLKEKQIEELQKALPNLKIQR